MSFIEWFSNDMSEVTHINLSLARRVDYTCGGTDGGIATARIHFDADDEVEITDTLIAREVYRKFKAARSGT